MIGRSRRNRQASMKARVGIATAVLVGGGAIGVAVAASHQGAAAPATNTAEAGFIMNFHHRISMQAALSSALTTWHRSHQQSLNTLAQMVPMRNFTQVQRHRTMYAAQRGVVELATPQFLLVKSASGANRLHLWWLSGNTQFMNVTTSATGMVAMSGNNTAAVQAVVMQNQAQAATVMAGSTMAPAQMAAPAAKPTTLTIDTGNLTITITITSNTATVTQPTVTATTVPATPTPTVTATGMPTVTPTTTVKPTTTSTAMATPTATAPATPTPSATATQPVTTAVHGIAAGDLVFVTGVRVHGRLMAQLVLFSVPAGMITATPTVSATVTVKPTVTATPSAVAPTGLTGTHS